MLVCSQTPNAALEAEWEEHDIARYVLAICGQEIGSKKESLAAAKQYPPNHTLMIGDAPGDYKAAVGEQLPVLSDQPRRRRSELAATVRRRHRRASSKARSPATYQQQLLDEFDTFLPERPPWRSG